MTTDCGSGRGLLIVLLTALLSFAALAQEPESNDRDATLDRAREILRTYSVDKPVRVRSFRAGLRVIGVSTQSGQTPAEDSGLESTFSLMTPEWLDPNRLLGVLRPGDPVQLRLLWKVEPVANEPQVPPLYTVSLQQRRGYNNYSQRNEALVIRREEHPTGTVLWTNHEFGDCASFTPGLYNVLVSNPGSSETLPLGQVLVQGTARPSQQNREEVTKLLPGSDIVFAGIAVQTEWCVYRFPVKTPSITPTKLAIVSSEDWFLKGEQLAELAKIAVVYANGHEDTFELRLGRDTNTSWYDLHARGNLSHTRPHVAWSWSIQREEIEFDAHTYLALFDLSTQDSPIRSIRISYTQSKGILRISAIALVP